MVLIYNAECVVTAARGTRLNVKILVDVNQADPSVGADFSFCSAVDIDGKTWVSAVRQSVMKVPTAGTHVVTIVARLFGGAGSWRLDDSSLVVQRALSSVATREDIYESASTDTSNFLPLKDNDATMLQFSTKEANEKLKLTYNAECVLAAQLASKVVQLQISVPDAAVPFNPGLNVLCSPVDTTGKTWAGAARQFAVTIPNTGSHTANVLGYLNINPGTWRINDSSLVITKGFLAADINKGGVFSSSTAETPVPIKPRGGTDLAFTTTAPNQVVKLSFSANCSIGAARGRWLGIRITVDGVEANPASGYDFALCASVTAGFSNHVAGFRQSVITVPTAGSHTVRVFAKASAVVTGI